ncbi:unnamed protein product [Symbiodinium microadriaticum]|nr:unnamed protein product [Symbiodinium sp. KB8]CAE7409258.1 unnamed protein product [Symbiodinium microadriaticum]
MEAREVEEAYQKFEESEEHIQELLDRGAITNDEARKLRTRAKMHQQDAEPDRPKISSAVMAGADQMTNEQMIEEALKGKRRFWLFEWMRKFFRIDRLQDRISREKRRRAHPDFVHKCPMISGMVKSGMTFELVTFFLVALNGLLTGVQISVQGTADELEIYGLFEEFFNISLWSCMASMSVGFSLRNVITYRRPEEALFTSDAVCTDSQEILQPFFLCEPPEQVRLFITLFCVSVAAGLIVNHPAAVRFYRLTTRANLTHNSRRGLGYTACKAYGLIPIPQLPESHFQMVGWLLVVSLLLACHSQLAPRFFLFAGFGLYFLYFGQLFCESKHGGHGALLLPSVLLLLALSGGPKGTPWSLVFIKLFLGVVYFAGAVSKVVVPCVFRRPWLGSTMQAYILDAMWSRPHSWGLVQKLQLMLLQRWWLCTSMAVSALIFEFGWLPLVLLGGRTGSVLAGAVAFSFHLGVDVLQGLDFKPFWCPVFWVFLPDLQSMWHGQEMLSNETWTAVLAQGFLEEPCRWIMSATYLLLQVVVAVRFMDCREGMECLPLTCCPMFAVPRNVFQDELRGGVLTDMDLRGGGHVDFAYNFFPWASDLPLGEVDMKRIPGRVLFWMSTLHCDPNLERLLNPDYLNKELLLSANFDISPSLESKLYEYVMQLEQASPEDWADPAKIGSIVELQAECRKLFEAHAPCNNSVQDSVDSGEINVSKGPVLLDFMSFFTPTFCFIAEIILRVIADGWTWFFTAGNASDVVLIAVTGIIPSYILGPVFDFQSPLFRIGQALRCIRLIRILKSVRTISYFRILWSLVSGIVDSGRILLWTLTIITVVLYMFSIFFVQLLLHSGLEFTPEVQSAVIDVHFSTVPDAMFTLFQCLTLDSWTSLSRPLQVGHPQIGILWVLYVAVACMVLNNLVIAVIVNNAFARAEQDEELQASIARETTEGELNDLRTLFDELAKEGSAYLSRKDYEQALGTSESLWTKLKIVNLEENEILNLWSFIDFPEEVDREYFASQIRNLKGECKAKTSFTVAMTLKKLDTRLNQARTNLEVHKRMCEELKKESREAQVELSRTLFELRQFMILTYRCIPSNATVTTKNKVQKVGEKVSTRVQPLLTPLLNYPYERVPMSIEEQKEGWALPGEVLEQKPETTLKPGTLPHASRAIRN